MREGCIPLGRCSSTARRSAGRSGLGRSPPIRPCRPPTRSGLVACSNTPWRTARCLPPARTVAPTRRTPRLMAMRAPGASPRTARGPHAARHERSDIRSPAAASAVDRGTDRPEGSIRRDAPHLERRTRTRRPRRTQPLADRAAAAAPRAANLTAPPPAPRRGRRARASSAGRTSVAGRRRHHHHLARRHPDGGRRTTSRPSGPRARPRPRPDVRGGRDRSSRDRSHRDGSIARRRAPCGRGDGRANRAKKRGARGAAGNSSRGGKASCLPARCPRSLVGGVRPAGRGVRPAGRGVRATGRRCPVHRRAGQDVNRGATPTVAFAVRG